MLDLSDTIIGGVVDHHDLLISRKREKGVWARNGAIYISPRIISLNPRRAKSEGSKSRARMSASLHPSLTTGVFFVKREQMGVRLRTGKRHISFGLFHLFFLFD